MKSSLAITACFVVGVVVGRLDWLSDTYDAETLSIYTLYALLLLVGLSMGSARRSWLALQSAGPRVLLVPACALIGSFAGAMLIGMLSPWSVREIMAVGAGLGYYSLSSLLIGQLHGSELATIALLANILREITTLLAAFPIRKFFGPLAPIASGGATSMDTTLPVIVATSGKTYAIVAVFNGMVLTLIVPVLVALALTP